MSFQESKCYSYACLRWPVMCHNGLSRASAGASGERGQGRGNDSALSPSIWVLGKPGLWGLEGKLRMVLPSKHAQAKKELAGKPPFASPLSVCPLILMLSLPVVTGWPGTTVCRSH